MFIKTITEPLQHMVLVSRAIGAGDLSHTARVDTRNELAQLSTAIDEMATNLQEIIMLSRAVCDSAGRVTRNASVLVADAPLAPGDANAMAAQLAGLTSELDTLGQVIDCFKLYSVDRRL
jgi:methyl-accepting chemotaxis protein